MSHKSYLKKNNHKSARFASIRADSRFAYFQLENMPLQITISENNHGQIKSKIKLEK